MIEAFARAICVAEGINPDERVVLTPEWHMRTPDIEWSSPTDCGAQWEQWIPHARAVIDVAVNQSWGDVPA